MTGEELRTQTEELMAGRSMNETLFYQLANIFKNVIEGMRPWMWLRKINTSNTVTSATTVDTAIDLPTDFRKPYNLRRPNGTKGSLFLKSSDGDIVYLDMIPFGQGEMYRDTNGYWFYDLRQRKFYITGRWSKTYTIYLHYIHKSAAIEEATEWILPDTDQHAILSHLVSASEKSGVDYDEINARQAIDNNKTASQILTSMIFDDDEAQRAQYGV